MDFGVPLGQRPSATVTQARDAIVYANRVCNFGSPGDGDIEDFHVFYNTTIPTSLGEFYSFGRFSHHDADGAAFFRWPDGFSGVPAVYPEGYRPITTGENDDRSVSAGLRGTAGEWEWDGSFTMFDEYPDLSNDDINFFGHLSYDVLSPVGMNGAYYYLRTQFDF